MTLGRRIRRFFRRNFEMAGASGRWPWQAMLPAERASALAQGPVMKARGAFLVNNTATAAAICNTFVSCVVGDGPSIHADTGNKAMDRALEDAWNTRFWPNADIDGGDLPSLMGRLMYAQAPAGEAFLRHVMPRPTESRVQMLLPEQIASDMDNGVNIVGGIEFDAMGQRVAYWVRPYTELRGVMDKPVRVDASEIMHVYDPKHPGAIRGTPWLAPVATAIMELDSLQDALLAKAKTAALFAGFIRDLDGQSGAAVSATDELSLEPGTLRVLPAGADITFTPTGDFTGTDAFLKHMQRQIAAGVGLPYEILFNDLSDATYSSAKLSLENFKRRVKALRASMLVSRFLQPVWERFVTIEILSGRINAPDFARNSAAYFNVSFLWPDFASIEPLKEAQADQILLQAGIRSRAEIIAARGRDIADVDAEIAADTYVPPKSNVVPIKTEAA